MRVRAMIRLLGTFTINTDDRLRRFGIIRRKSGQKKILDGDYRNLRTQEIMERTE